MARARVELREGSSYVTTQGVKFVCGVPQVLTKSSVIEFCRSNSRFCVTDLKEEVKSSVARVVTENTTDPQAESKMPSIEQELAKFKSSSDKMLDSKKAETIKRKRGRPSRKG